MTSHRVAGSLSLAQETRRLQSMRPCSNNHANLVSPQFALLRSPPFPAPLSLPSIYFCPVMSAISLPPSLQVVCIGALTWYYPTRLYFRNKPPFFLLCTMSMSPFSRSVTSFPTSPPHINLFLILLCCATKKKSIVNFATMYHTYNIKNNNNNK